MSARTERDARQHSFTAEVVLSIGVEDRRPSSSANGEIRCRLDNGRVLDEVKVQVRNVGRLDTGACPIRAIAAQEIAGRARGTQSGAAVRLSQNTRDLTGTDRIDVCVRDT